MGKPSGEIRIDAELRALIPPLADDERALLEANILRDGCRDPLVVWGDVLLDGHHRFDICRAHGLPFLTVAVSLKSRAEAADWIDTNQLGRRNLTPEQASLLRGRRYNRTKQPHGGDRRSSHQSDDLKTSVRLAQEHGVSQATIERDGQFADAVETLKPHVHNIEQRVLAGDVPSKQAVIDAAREPAKAARLLTVHFSSESSEHYTPREVIDAVVECLGGIDLDPCSNDGPPNVPARAHYRKVDDGLAQPWGGRVFINPPYGREIGAWIHKLRQEWHRGEITAAIALLPSRTDTEWFDELTTDTDDAVICFVHGRLTFIGNDDPAPFPSMLVYYGSHHHDFARVFGELGSLWCRPSRPAEWFVDHSLEG